MMMFDCIPFARALGIGAAVAAPVGPMSLLCMRRTLVQGSRFGLSTGAGIAAGDATFATVAAFGLAGVTHFMLDHQRPLHAAAGLFLMYLGWRTVFAGVPKDARSSFLPTASVRAAFASALLLTLTNPPTIISFVAIFAALTPQAGLDPAYAFATVAGVFSGSLLWWCFLTAVITAVRSALGARTRGWIDRLSGAVLGLLGVSEFRRAL